LHTVYNSGLYNFYYAALIYDENPKAQSRLDNAYNIAWTPTCYFDAGYSVHDGITQTQIADGVTQAGIRPVHDLAVAIDVKWLGANTIEVELTVTNNELINTIPDVPDIPDGPTAGTVSFDYAFEAATTDPDGDQLYYQFFWGDDTFSDWLGPYPGDEKISGSHAWSQAGNYIVQARVKDQYDAESPWSDMAAIAVYDAGDANSDGAVNVGDAVFIINYVFKGGQAPSPVECGNANCDAAVNVGDAVFIINYVFKGGAAPGCP